MEKSCEKCGKSFEVKRYLFDVRKHCSAECKHEANRVTLTCKCCGKVWETWKSQIKISGRPGAGQFCSKACADLAKKTKPEKPPKEVKPPIYKSCEVCDKTFRIWPSRKESARFCSLACKGSSESYRETCSDQQQAEKHWRWDGGRYQTENGYVRFKRKVRGVETIKFEHTTVVLEWIMEVDPNHAFLVTVDGVKRLHPDLCVHHIDRNKSNNDRSNLLVVTNSAHGKIHHGNKRPDPWECWPSQPTRW